MFGHLVLVQLQKYGGRLLTSPPLALYKRHAILPTGIVFFAAIRHTLFYDYKSMRMEARYH